MMAKVILSESDAVLSLRMRTTLKDVLSLAHNIRSVVYNFTRSLLYIVSDEVDITPFLTAPSTIEGVSPFIYEHSFYVAVEAANDFPDVLTDLIHIVPLSGSLFSLALPITFELVHNIFKGELYHFRIPVRWEVIRSAKFIPSDHIHIFSEGISTSFPVELSLPVSLDVIDFSKINDDPGLYVDIRVISGQPTDSFISEFASCYDKRSCLPIIKTDNGEILLELFIK